MLFNSIHFLFFLPVVTLFYYLLKNKWRWILLFIASTYFYSVFFLPYILILYAIIIIDYVCGILIHKSTSKIRIFWLLISILSNIGILAYFKYYNFFIDVFSAYIPSLQHIEIILPIGLSFHTFQSLSYTIEVYRGKQMPEKHIGYFANYVLFFPQMIAGPIERFDRLGTQFRLKHRFKYKNISNGLRLILYGLFIKMCVADNLAPLVNTFYDNPTAYVSSSAWIALIAFSIQIYADFYGYSTIAIGAAKMLDIHLMDNFKQPYFAASFKVFWQRWHISLSTWFRSYVFIPLGGSKVNTVKWVFNILVVFALSGFWHGANYTFIIWGLLHASFYILEAAMHKALPIAFVQSKVFKYSAIPITFILVSFIWIFFRAPNLAVALQALQQCFTYSLASVQHIQIPPTIAAMVVLFVALEVLTIHTRFDYFLQKRPLAIRWSIYTVLLLAILLFSGIQSFQFIYFQF